MPIRPFTLAECAQYADYKRLGFDRRQVLECYMAFGGVAYYWSLLEEGKSAAQNFDALFFGETAELRMEFENVFRCEMKYAPDDHQCRNPRRPLQGLKTPPIATLLAAEREALLQQKPCKMGIPQCLSPNFPQNFAIWQRTCANLWRGDVAFFRLLLRISALRCGGGWCTMSVKGRLEMIKMMIAAAALATTMLAAAAESEYDFRRRLEVVHQADMRDPCAKRAAN